MKHAWYSQMGCSRASASVVGLSSSMNLLGHELLPTIHGFVVVNKQAWNGFAYGK